MLSGEKNGCAVTIRRPRPAGMNPPTQHVADAWQSAEFYANKVLMEHRNTDR